MKKLIERGGVLLSRDAPHDVGSVVATLANDGLPLRLARLSTRAPVSICTASEPYGTAIGQGDFGISAVSSRGNPARGIDPQVAGLS